MMRRFATLARLRCDQNGSMLIETAFVAPILLILALGGFEVSSMVARQSELQSAAAEAAAVVRAVIPETREQMDTVEGVVESSTGLAAEQVTVVPIYRCGTAADYTTIVDSCGSGVTQYKFIQLDITDTYTPVWTNFGVGTGVDYYVSRTVQIG